MTWYPGQHFDSMVRVSEKNLEGEALGIMRKVLRQAKLFVFDEPAHLILPKEYSEEDQAWYRNNLHLPFPITAVEDPASVVLLQRTYDAEDPTILPFNKMNILFYAWVPIAQFDGSRVWDKQPSEKDLEYVSQYAGTDTGTIMTGMVYGMRNVSPTCLEVNGTVLTISVFEKGEFRNKISGKQIPSSMHDDVLREAKTAVEQIMLINAPDRFVLETQPVLTEKQQKKRNKDRKKAALSNSRSIFSILHPQLIRKQMHLPEPGEGGASVRGHDVRSHTRTLAHERYTNKRGKTIIVKAHWRGPKENIVGNKRYIVRLDL